MQQLNNRWREIPIIKGYGPNRQRQLLDQLTILGVGITGEGLLIPKEVEQQAIEQEKLNKSAKEEQKQSEDIKRRNILIEMQQSLLKEKQALFLNQFQSLIQYLIVLCYGIVLLAGFYLFHLQHITMGQLIMFYMLVSYCIQPVLNMVALASQYKQVSLIYDKYKNFEVDLEKSKCTLDQPITSIRYDDVTYAYGYQLPVLEHIDLNIQHHLWIKGITGSGKTEIYMQMIEKVLKKGQQAIVLVPEISLTPQIVERFLSRFGNQVSVTHSRLNYGERYDQWKKARDNDISIIIGPRSALFMPFENLGMIIIDEEHESSYRSDITPKYDAKEVAEQISRITGCMLLLGSATPDLVTYHKAVTGKYTLLELKERTKGSHLPHVTITDMRKELEEGNRSVFGAELLEAIRENLKNKRQTMLFLNRRGYATFVSCRKCGHVMKCDACDITYTYHAAEEELVCHYCGKRVANPTICPECGSKYIKYFGAGTQKIEQETKRLFPQATILRMDSDTTMTKNSHQKILEQFRQGNADILIGTQMIAKGHDFANVTLVGVLAADLSLHMSSYRASEISFQLITQAAGRAGRDELPGQVFIQTYDPEHYSIVLAAKQDYEAFYKQEIQMRKMMAYPPFSHIFTVLLSAKQEKEVIESARYLADIMVYYNRKGKLQILGPTPAVLSKFRQEYRWRILIKCQDEEVLKQFVIFCKVIGVRLRYSDWVL